LLLGGRLPQTYGSGRFYGLELGAFLDSWHIRVSRYLNL